MRFGHRSRAKEPAIPWVAYFSVTLDDGFIKRFGPGRVEFIPDLPLITVPQTATYKMCPVHVALPKPNPRHEQCEEVRLILSIGDTRLANYTVRISSPEGESVSGIPTPTEADTPICLSAVPESELA